jgi:transcriptional regulator with XRE-family HTH domain
MPRCDPTAQRIVALGLDLFGDSWQGQFARMCGLSRPYVTRIAKGERPVTEAVKVAIVAGLRAEAKRLRSRAVELTAAANEFGEG